MPREVHEDKVTVKFLAGGVASADLSAVTAAEWGNATLLGEITADGVNPNSQKNNASIAMLDGAKIGQKPGTRSKSVTLRFTRLSGADAQWDLFDYGTSGDLLISRFGDAPATGDPVEVYRGASHEPDPIASAQDTYQQFDVEFPCDDWNVKAAMVA